MVKVERSFPAPESLAEEAKKENGRGKNARREISGKKI